MRQLIVSLLAAIIIAPAVYGQDDEIRSHEIGVSFNLHDFKTAELIRTTSLSAVLKNKQFGDINEMSPGLGLHYFKGLKKHIDFAGSITAAVQRVRENTSGLEIEVETRTLDDVREALELGVERILLDNMSLEMMREAVTITAGQAKLEASGNVTIENVRQVALTGVDYISVGALTHSVKVFDVSLEWTSGH